MAKGELEEVLGELKEEKGGLERDLKGVKEAVKELKEAVMVLEEEKDTLLSAHNLEKAALEEEKLKQVQSLEVTISQLKE